MNELAATAERLRVVKQACQHFLTLHALDRMMNKPVLFNRFAEDIEHFEPEKRDWSHLYSGSVLDD